MDQQSPVSWLFKCGLSAAALLIGCGIAADWLGNRPQLPATTTRDGTLITLNRYVQEAVPDVVLVGSALTYRLNEVYFATPRLRNLALAGGSPITGLDVVLAQPRLPGIVLVEANVMSRPLDDTLVARFGQGQSAEPRLFRPIRMAVAAYENWIHAPLSHAQITADIDDLLKQRPSDFDNRIYVSRAVKAYGEDPTVAVQANVERLAELMQKARQLGVRVMLFELPFPKEIEATRTVDVTRRLVHGRFAEPGQWLPIDVEASELRWLDGVHLDERSAMLISRSIDKTLGRLALGKILRTD
jgi:hypothetical protein